MRGMEGRDWNDSIFPSEPRPAASLSRVTRSRESGKTESSQSRLSIPLTLQAP